MLCGLNYLIQFCLNYLMNILMKLVYRNIIALQLMLLILFSTIGYNIITSFCYGCEEEHTEVVFNNAETEICSCCEHEVNDNSCCSKKEAEHKEHHQTSSKLFQLKFESPEAKSKAAATILPLTLTFLVNILVGVENSTNSTVTTFRFTHEPPPAISGRTILTLICILRN